MSKIAQILQEHDLDFTPKKFRQYIQIGKRRIVNPKQMGIVRHDGGRADYLGEAGQDYTAVPYRQALAFLDPVIASSAESKVEVRRLKGDAAIAVYVSLAAARLHEGYEVVKQVSLVATHDGGRSITAIMTPQVKLPQGSTVVVPVRSEEFKFRHTKLVKERLERASRLLGLTDEFFAGLQDEFAQMAGIPLRKDQPEHSSMLLVGKMLDTVTPPADKGKLATNRHTATTVLNRHIEVESPTLFNAFIGLVEYVTQHRRVTREENREWGNLTSTGLDMVARLRNVVADHVGDENL